MKNWANPWRISFPSSMKMSTSFCKNFLQSCFIDKITFFQLFRHGGTKHHNLLIVWSFDEDLLNIRSHTWISEHLIAFVDNEEFALNNISRYLIELDDIVSCQVFQSSWCGDDYVGVFIWVSEIRNVVFQGDTSEESSKSQLRLFEISA